MKKILGCSLVALLLLTAGSLRAQTQEETGKIIPLNTKAFKERVYDYEKSAKWVYSGDKPCIIDFYADWCGPCRKLKPVLERLAKEYKGRIYVYSIDVDRNKRLADAFKVESIPMTLVVPMEGIPLMNTGALPYGVLKKQVETALRQAREGATKH